MALASQSDTLSHTVTIEDAGPSRKRLHFTIPAAVVAERLGTSLDALASEAALPGFRPGRAPKRLIEKKFGASIRGEAKSQMVSAAYSQAVQDHKLNVLGDPEGNEELAKLELDPRADLKFHLDVEVMPEFDLPNLDGFEVLRPTIEVKADQVDEQIKKLQINEGSLEEQAKASEGDYCIGHGVMRDPAGKSVIDINGAVIQIPTADKGGIGAILGVIVNDFSKQVGLPAPGDVLSVKAKGPENHEHEEVRGKDITIEFKVAQVQRIIPCPMADLLARTGHGEEAQLRETVKTRLEQRARIEQQAAMRQQVAKHLVETVEVPLPERLTARQAQQNLSRARYEMMYRGFDEHQIEERQAQLRATSAATAVRDLKLTFILAKAAQAFQVQITQEEVLGRIAQMAFERGVRPDAMRQDLEKKNQIGFVVQQVREHKCMDILLAKTKVSDVTIDEFNAKFGKGADALGGA